MIIVNFSGSRLIYQIFKIICSSLNTLNLVIRCFSISFFNLTFFSVIDLIKKVEVVFFFVYNVFIIVILLFMNYYCSGFYFIFNPCFIIKDSYDRVFNLIFLFLSIRNLQFQMNVNILLSSIFTVFFNLNLFCVLLGTIYLSCLNVYVISIGNLDSLLYIRNHSLSLEVNNVCCLKVSEHFI